MENKRHLPIILAIIFLTGIAFIVYFWDSIPFEKGQKEEKKQLDSKEFPLSATMINQHFSNISKKNIDDILENYSDDAQIDWEGDPLSGRYDGREKISSFWDNFFSNVGFVSSEMGGVILFEGKSKIGAQVIFYPRESSGNKKIEKNLTLVFDKDGKIESEKWEDRNDDLSKSETQDDSSQTDSKIASGKIESVNQQEITLLSSDGSREVLKLTSQTEVNNDLQKEDGDWGVEDVEVGQNVDLLFDASSREIISLFIVN